MAGYNPNCDNCFKCGTCRGEGTIMKPVSRRKPDGTYVHERERVTCPTCKGVGGKVGAGSHDHR
jgi:hypothetical protein